MKNTGIILAFLLLFLSCDVNKSPEFISITNAKVVETTNNFITIKADALFKNPNDISGKLQTDEIQVFVNGNPIAIVSSEHFDVPAKKEFTMPLTAKIETKKLVSNTNLSSLLGSIFKQKISIQYKGDINYKIFGFSHTYHLDETEDIRIKL